MVIESEIKKKNNNGGAKPNAGRWSLFGDVPVTRRQVRLPDSAWDILNEMYPDDSASVSIYRLINEYPQPEKTSNLTS